MPKVKQKAESINFKVSGFARILINQCTAPETDVLSIRPSPSGRLLTAYHIRVEWKQIFFEIE